MDDPGQQYRRRDREEWTPTYRVQHHFIGLFFAIVDLARTLDWSPLPKQVRNVTPESEEKAA